MPFLRKNQLWIYFVLALGFSAGWAWCAHATGNTGISILIPLSPTLIAIGLTAVVSGRKGLRGLLNAQMKGMKWGWLGVSLLLVPGLIALAVVAYSFFGGPALALRTTELFPAVPVIVLIALGEEFGWRGYALPRLQKKWNALTASLMLWGLWVVWHYPGHLIGSGTPLGLNFVVFSMMVLPLTVLLTWVYNNTRSIWAPILMHAGSNAAFNYLPLLPEWTGDTGGFAVYVGLAWVAMLVVVWVYGRESLAR